MINPLKFRTTLMWWFMGKSPQFLAIPVFQLPANPCLPNPCENQGKCEMESDKGFICICKQGFQGKVCQHKQRKQPHYSAHRSLNLNTPTVMLTFSTFLTPRRRKTLMLYCPRLRYPPMFKFE